jgi:hypothetical protein
MTTCLRELPGGPVVRGGPVLQEGGELPLRPARGELAPQYR